MIEYLRSVRYDGVVSAKTEYCTTIGELYVDAVTSAYGSLFVYKGENYGSCKIGRF